MGFGVALVVGLEVGPGVLFTGELVGFGVLFVGELVGSGAVGEVGTSEAVGEVVGDVETIGGVGFGVKLGGAVGTDPPSSV